MTHELGLNKVYKNLKGQPKMDWALKVLNVDKIHMKTKGEGVKVMVIDSGIDVNHPEFEDSFKDGFNMIDKTKDLTDEYGHGTHVAGLIAGKRTGVAPNCELYVAKVLNDEGKGTMFHVMDGITSAINYNVDVLCLSLGTVKDLPNMVIERIREAYNHGITIVSATGNSGGVVQYPARLEEVIGVGGLDSTGITTRFTNVGEGLDICAPAVGVLSAFKDGQYARMTGTSMASPIVAGLCALAISYHREKGIELTPKQVKTALLGVKDNGMDTLELLG